MAEYVKFKHPTTGSTVTATKEVRDALLSNTVLPRIRAVEEAEPEVITPEPPASNGSKAAWHAYRLAQGHSAEELEGMGRNALRDLA